jgi:GT2 family glycosyltransferase
MAEENRVPAALTRPVTRLGTRSGDPEISVVMVTHGAWELTEQAIASVIAHTQHRIELIVVDNNSPDETRARLSELRSAEIIFNELNRGFGPATNQGVARARAPYLLLLNSDAFVHAGWLGPLLETLEDENVAAVVPRLLDPDGSLQDAGPLLAQDGTVCAYGDGDHPGRLSYRFRRMVDYGSAACMLIRRSAFQALGGFDDAFAPAYYEDADLCLRLAQRGLKVIYEPRSTVTHVRYGSGSSDQAEELSERNRRLFVERWGQQLQGRPWTFTSATEQAVIVARDAPSSPRVLICSRAPDAAAEALASTLLAKWPWSRVTWATGAPVPTGWSPEPWLRLGVEVVDEADLSWLDKRLFLYDLVVLDRDRERHPALIATLERTQPQAPRVALGALRGAPEQILAAAGVAPPQDGWC